MKKAICVLALGILECAAAFAQGRADAAAPQVPPTETVTPAIPGVVAAGTTVQIIRGPFKDTQGPIAWSEGSILFTDTDANQVTKIDKEDISSTFLEKTNGSNALALDARGRLISVQTTPGQAKVGVIYPKGSEAVLADNFEGRPLGRPNDLVVDKKGGIYFTDPGAGANPVQGAPPPTVYYIPPGGKALKVADGFRPNGIQLSPNDKILYVNNTNGEYLLAFDIQPNGTLANRRNFAKYDGVRQTAAGFNSGADGLAIDSRGRIYVATPLGIQVFSPQGEPLGTIPLPGPPQNLAFAGPDKKTLYIGSRSYMFKIRMIAQGFKGRAK